MSAKNPHGFYVGQSLYASPSNRSLGGEKIIQKIGNKWVTLNDGERFDILTMHVDGGNYMPRYSIWKSKEVYENDLKLSEAWKQFHRKMQYAYSVPKNMTIDKVNQILAILEVQP